MTTLTRINPLPSARYSAAPENRFTRRPWLRYIEGVEGAQAGGDGGAAGAEGGKTGDPASTPEPPAATPPPAVTPAPPAPAAPSEPAPKPNEAGDKADGSESAEVAELKAQLAKVQDSLGILTKSHEEVTAEKRAQLVADVAKGAGLPESMADRLAGDTREQLEADAKTLAQVLGFRVVDPTQGAGAGGSVGAPSLDNAIAAKIAAAGLK